MNTEIKTTLTTNILIKADDNTWMVNCYNEMAKFIGTASLIDSENKIYKQIRFESAEPFIKDKVNIQAEWLDFDKKIQAFISEYPKAFDKKDSHKPIAL